jgi:hypothetical protein
MVTSAISGGVDHTIVSHVSQHRDVNTLQRYVNHSSSSSRATTAAIGSAMATDYDEYELSSADEEPLAKRHKPL